MKEWKGYPWGWLPRNARIISWACSACIEAGRVLPGHKRCHQAGYRLVHQTIPAGIGERVLAIRAIFVAEGEPSRYEVLEVHRALLTEKGWEAAVSGRTYRDIWEVLTDYGSELRAKLIPEEEWAREVKLTAFRDAR